MSSLESFLEHLLGDEREWMRDAACAGIDPDLFFPERGDAGHVVKVAIQELCGGCPVRPECLDYAVRHAEQDGWWGGMDPRDRRKVRKERIQAGIIPASNRASYHLRVPRERV